MIQSLYSYIKNEKEDLTEQTARDLNLDQVFKKINHTQSAIGAQYLYAALRKGQNSKQKLQVREELIDYLAQEKQRTHQLDKEFQRFNKPVHYLLPEFIFSEERLALPFLHFSRYSVMAMLLSLAATFIVKEFIVLTALLALVNSTLHYINKIRIESQINLLKAFHDFIQVSDTIKQHPFPEATGIKFNSNRHKAYHLIISILSLEFSDSKKLFADEVSQMASLLMEGIKSVFCLDYFLLEYLHHKVDHQRESLYDTYCQLGELDTALSILKLRRETNHCVPELDKTLQSVSVLGMSHPLIPDCITNPAEIDTNGLVLTGSNMSGKTSYIKSVAVNAILAQTIHTCFAKKYSAPFLRVHSIIGTEDNLVEGKSFFKSELDQFKQLIGQCTKGGQKHLILVDEPLKGTNTHQSVAISFSFIQHLQAQKNNFLLLTTHELKLAQMLEGINFTPFYFEEKVSGNDIIFDYRIKRGVVKNFNAIELLSKNGFSETIIAQAKASYHSLSEA